MSESATLTQAACRRQFPRQLLHGIATPTTFLLLLSVSQLCSIQPVMGESSERPNIVFILADDLGYSELGCQGNTFNETPRLDRLAAGGMRFTDAYAAAPVCSPYRASLMSGQWPARVGISDYLRPDDPKHLPLELLALPGALKAGGYATGMIGKWHLTGYQNHGAEEFPPGVHGFDEVIASENRGIAGGSYFHPYHFNRELQPRLKDVEHPRTKEATEYLTDRINLEAVEFIERHRQEPFFLFKSHYAVHTRLDGRPDLVAKYEAKPGAGKGQQSQKNNPHLAAQLEVIDRGVGMIVDKLNELGLLEKTILIFTSDNGGEVRVSTNAPLRAGKSTLYEGGIREPLIVHWPGVVAPGTLCRGAVCSVDFFPTFLELAGVKPKQCQELDGVSLVPLLKNARASLGRRTLYWHYPLLKPHFLGGRSSGAIRDGDWKLIEFFDDQHVELYNLAQDVGERKDLSNDMPEQVERLRGNLRKWRTETGAEVFAGLPNVAIELAGKTLLLEDNGTKPIENRSPEARKFDGRGYLDLPRASAPTISGHSIEVSARVTAKKPNGVIYAHGGNRWGLSLYLADGRPAFATCIDWKRTVVAGPEPLAQGSTLTARLEKQGQMTLAVDGRIVAQAKAPGLFKSEPGDSIQVGADTVQPVGEYESPNYFTGVIDDLALKIQTP